MRCGILIVGLVLAMIDGGVFAAAAEREIFSDTFQTPQVSSNWTVHEGNWAIENGALVNKDGGLITLTKTPGASFSMELEIGFPSNWISVILFFTDPENYGTLYFAEGYWESFEMEGKKIDNYIQHKDPEIVTTNGYHKIKVVSEYGLVALSYDGKFKGLTAFPYRSGARLGFRSVKNSGLLKIKNFGIKQIIPADIKIAYRLQSEDFSKGVLYKDYENEGKPDAADRLTIDANAGAAELKYSFAAGEVFESCFVRIPVDVAKCNTILMDMEGDGSKNNFFLIVHDISGEQHLAVKSCLTWQGWQEVGVNLKAYFESPDKMERSIIHWGGDESQEIDFPIKAIDIGVAKHGTKVKDSGQVRFRNVRFME